MLEAIVTAIIIGVLGTVGYLVKKTCIEPNLRLKEIIVSIDETLRFYENIITSPQSSPEEKKAEAAKALRDCYSKLSSNETVVRFLRRRDSIQEASKILMRLHHSFYDGSEALTNFARVKEVRKLLGIEDARD